MSLLLQPLKTTATKNVMQRSHSRAADHSQNLVVTQKSSGSLTVTTSKIERDAAGGEAVIEVMAEIDYTYEIDSKCKGWITYKGTRAVQTSRLVFDVAANSGKEKREGRITIRGGGRTETVTIYQAGETPTIVLTQNKYEYRPQARRSRSRSTAMSISPYRFLRPPAGSRRREHVHSRPIRNTLRSRPIPRPRPVRPRLRSRIRLII